MKNYIINNKTIAILKNNNKTVVYNENEIINVDKNIITLLNNNCLFYGSTLDGRREYIKRLINIKYKLPIYITKNIILIQLNSLRDDKCLFIVLNKIIDYDYQNEYLTIRCTKDRYFKNKISKYSFEKLLINGIKINNIIKDKKS